MKDLHIRFKCDVKGIALAEDKLVFAPRNGATPWQ